MGFAFKLVYHMDSAFKSPNLLTTVLLVPPREQLGIRTQFSCPLDAFVFIDDEDYDAQAISITSSCLGLNLGLFEIFGLKTHLYIFDKCRASPFCSVLEYTDTFIIWSEFPQNTQSVRLGNFIELLPTSDSNRTALYATVSSETIALQAKLFNAKLSLFEVIFNCTATIDNQQLYFEIVVKLFDNYPAKLSGTMKRNVRNNTIIEIYGHFLDSIDNNIPELLCKEIKTYVDLVYNRSSSRVRIAEAAYNKSKEQYYLAELTYNETEANMRRSASIIQVTENELLNVKSNIKSLENNLKIAGDEFNDIKEAIEMMANKCSINQCANNEICDPQGISMPHQQDVTTPVQDVCRVPCSRIVETSDVVGYRNDTTWKYESQTKCKESPNCRLMECSIQTECVDDYISGPKTSEIPTIGPVLTDENIICYEPCPEEQISTSVEIPHSENVGCKINDSLSICIIGLTGENAENEQCFYLQETVEEQLKNVNHEQAFLLKALQKSRENETVTKLHLMRYKAQYKLNEDQFNVSKVAIRDKEIALMIAETIYEQVKEQNPLDLLQNITNVSVCGSSSAYLKIKSVDFSTVINTESPAILETDITVSIPSLNKVLFERAFINFHNINSSLKEVAVAISGKILDQKLTSSRQYRNVYSTNSNDSVHLEFQKRCTDIKNTLTYVKELNTSISSLAAFAISVIVEFDKNANEIQSTIDGIPATAANRSTGTEELKQLMEEYVTNNQYIASNIQLELFQSWQAKMEYLHNQTKSAAGFPCLGFSDCLKEVVDSLDDLVSSIPLQNYKDVAAFASAQQDLLDLALLQTYSIISAVANTEKIYKIANDSVLYNYWCANPPNITVQPPKHIAARENTTVELTCEVEIVEHVTYQWKKNSVQLPNQRNNKLVLKDIKQSDSGNYTCIVTNQVSSTTSIDSSVEVQQFPSFFLQPENVDVYYGSMNGAIFKSNATGFPNPGYRWYFQPKGATKFTLIPEENQNELVIVTPLPENEGSYFCEAFNEQGTTRSRIANLTVLESTVVQATRTVHLNFTKLDNNNSVMSGEVGSGNEPDVNIIALTETAIMALQREIVTTMHTLLSFDSTSLGNFTITPLSTTTIGVSFTLFSKNISYLENPLSEINQLAPKARLEWLPVWDKLQEVLAISEFFVSNENEEYRSDPVSLRFGMLEFSCPPGKEESSVNNLLCGKYVCEFYLWINVYC